MGAKDAGTPKSTNACFDPARSASLVTPATLKTKTSSTRARSSATSMNILFPVGWQNLASVEHYILTSTQKEGGTGVEADPTATVSTTHLQERGTLAALA